MLTIPHLDCAISSEHTVPFVSAQSGLSNNDLVYIIGQRMDQYIQSWRPTESAKRRNYTSVNELYRIELAQNVEERNQNVTWSGRSVHYAIELVGLASTLYGGRKVENDRLQPTTLQHSLQARSMWLSLLNAQRSKCLSY
jgi:hypothetical protein